MDSSIGPNQQVPSTIDGKHILLGQEYILSMIRRGFCWKKWEHEMHHLWWVNIDFVTSEVRMKKITEYQGFFEWESEVYFLYILIINFMSNTTLVPQEIYIDPKTNLWNQLALHQINKEEFNARLDRIMEWIPERSNPLGDLLQDWSLHVGTSNSKSIRYMNCIILSLRNLWL